MLEQARRTHLCLVSQLMPPTQSLSSLEERRAHLPSQPWGSVPGAGVILQGAAGPDTAASAASWGAGAWAFLLRASLFYHPAPTPGVGGSP